MSKFKQSGQTFLVDGRAVSKAEFDRLWLEDHPWHKVDWSDMRFKVHGSEQSFSGNRSQYEYDDNVGKLTLQAAKAAGISTHGKHYVSGLADKRGPRDPEAWVSDSSDVLRVAKKRGLRLRGSVNYEPPQVEPKPKKRRRLAPDLVREKVKQAIEKNPDLKHKLKTRKGREDIEGAIIDKHGAPA